MKLKELLEDPQWEAFYALTMGDDHIYRWSNFRKPLLTEDRLSKINILIAVNPTTNDCMLMMFKQPGYGEWNVLGFDET